MVAILQMFIVLSFFQQDPPTFDELFPKSPPPEIVSVGKVGESESLLKPCQPFTVSFEVTLAGEALRTQWPRIARQVSDLVRVNDHDYKNRLTGAGSTNDACVFELLWPQPAGGEPPPKSSNRALLAAACQYILKDRTCLFREPGDYRLEFFFGDHTVVTTVHVAVPAEEERRIIETLSTVPMLLFLLHPTDPQYATPENIAIVESLRKTPSDYSDLLSWTVGVAKAVRVGQPPWRDLTDQQRRSELEERSRLLESVRNEDRLTSHLSALAAFELANVSAQLAVSDPDSDKRAKHLIARDQLISKVAECELAPREQGMAKRYLQDVGREP